jgi:hypothetical protein
VVTPPDHDSSIEDDCGYNTVVVDANSNHPDDDFAYVNVTEMDADEVDIILDGTDVAFIPNEPQRGDVLAVLLSGMQQCESDALMVRPPDLQLICIVWRSFLLVIAYSMFSFVKTSTHIKTPIRYSAVGACVQNQTEGANEAAMKASEAKKQGDLLAALEYHTQASKLYRDSAVSIRDRNCKFGFHNSFV